MLHHLGTKLKRKPLLSGQFYLKIPTVPETKGLDLMGLLVGLNGVSAKMKFAFTYTCIAPVNPALAGLLLSSCLI